MLQEGAASATTLAAVIVDGVCAAPVTELALATEGDDPAGGDWVINMSAD